MNDETDVVFRDAIMLALAGFICIIVLIMAFINPIVREKDEEAPGNLIVEAEWQSGADTDVDLWVKAPGDRPVGYSNKSSTYFNLLRDDLGKISDTTSLNYEFCYTRGIPAGEYIINLHGYRGEFPMEVSITIRLKKTPEASALSILFKKVTLNRGQELTVVRFRLDEEGNLVKSSVNNLPISLRSYVP